MFDIISCSFLSTSSRLQRILIAFWLISNPETATPPALAAFPGPNKILFSKKTFIASASDGILAPSATQMQPFFTKVCASSLLISFCVALGRVTSHLAPQGRFPSQYSPPNSSVYSFILPLRMFFKSIIHCNFLLSIPSLSYILPDESLIVTTFPPN